MDCGQSTLAKHLGADGIPPKLLQMVAQEVTPTVHHLFNPLTAVDVYIRLGE